MKLSSIPERSVENNGFTLIELLIAITLLGLIAVVTYGAIWTVNRSLQAMEENVNVSDELRVTHDFIRRAVSQARGVMSIRDNLMQVVFSGEKDNLVFVAPAPLQRGNSGGLYRYRLDLDSKNGHSVLRLSYWQYLVGVEEEAEPEPQGSVILTHHIGELGFSYFGTDEPGEDPKWVDEWLRPDLLPQLVKITLKREDSDIENSITVAIKGTVG